MAKNKTIRTATAIENQLFHNRKKNPFYRTPEEIRVIADEQVERLTMEISALNVPTAYPEEFETDENTVELRKAIEKYIARTQDERIPFDPAQTKRIPWDIRDRLQASA